MPSSRARRGDDRPVPPSARPAVEKSSPSGRAPARLPRGTRVNTGVYSRNSEYAGSTSGAAAARRCASTGPTAAARTRCAHAPRRRTAPRHAFSTIFGGDGGGRHFGGGAGLRAQASGGFPVAKASSPQMRCRAASSAAARRRLCSASRL